MYAGLAKDLTSVSVLARRVDFGFILVYTLATSHCETELKCVKAVCVCIPCIPRYKLVYNVFILCIRDNIILYRHIRILQVVRPGGTTATGVNPAQLSQPDIIISYQSGPAIVLQQLHTICIHDVYHDNIHMM